MKTACTYIHARPNGTPFYIGKAKDFKRPYTMRRNRHHDFIVAKYGTHNIKVRIIRCRDEAHAFAMEVQIIADLRAMGIPLANMTDGGEGASGAVRSSDTLAKLSAAGKGNKNALGLKHTAETRAKISAATIGGKKPPRSDEHRAKLSAAKMGNKNSLGNKHSAETRAKMSAAWIGRIAPYCNVNYTLLHYVAL